MITGFRPTAIIVDEIDARKLGKAKGGYARAAVMTPEQRSACARKAAQTRWSKPMEGRKAEADTRVELLLVMNDAEAGKLMRYISQYKSGGFQNFMRKLVLRALRDKENAT